MMYSYCVLIVVYQLFGGVLLLSLSAEGDKGSCSANFLFTTVEMMKPDVVARDFCNPALVT